MERDSSEEPKIHDTQRIDERPKMTRYGPLSTFVHLWAFIHDFRYVESDHHICVLLCYPEDSHENFDCIRLLSIELRDLLKALQYNGTRCSFVPVTAPGAVMDWTSEEVASLS